MSEAMRDGHEQWDELAAGYALHALEPDEELVFTDHLRGCAVCAARLDEHAFVAAQLGSVVGDSDAGHPPAWSAMRESVVGGIVHHAPVASLDARRARRRPPRLLGAAAAAVVLAGVGVAVWQQTQSTTSPATRAITACERQSGCSVIRLHASHGPDPAVVLVSAGRVTMVPTAMKPPATDRTYVLWQVLRNGRPTAVTAFRDTAHQTQSALPTSYADTAAFAVSLEPAGTPPAQPTQVLAIGNTTA